MTAIASSVTLSDAHCQWANRPADQRFKSLEELQAAVDARRAVSRQRPVEIGKLKVLVTDRGDLQLNGQNAAASFTHWSFSQTCSRLTAPAGYLRRLPAAKAADLLNFHISQAPAGDEGKVLFHGATPAEYKVQALTSPKYGRIWDADVVSAARRFVDISGGKFYNPKAYANGRWGAEPEPSGLYASDRDCFIFLIDGGSVFDVGPRAQLNRGIFIWNSEVGNGTFGFTTFTHNSVCGNHFVWGAQNVQTRRIIHTASGPDKFLEAAPELVTIALQSFDPVVEVVKKAQRFELPAEDNDPKGFWDRVDGLFSKPEITTAKEYAEREEGKLSTLWDLQQGFTASARELVYVDARVDLEKRAGKLLDLVA